jgi:4-alpha-glucanotransferase/alpha-amylase
MSSPVSLLFGVHAHQPADNFPEVIAHVADQCYRPFLRTLHAFPEFRFAFHCSGPLYAMLCERYPADMRLLDDMAARGQVEILGGGDAEPVLAAIPDRDRRAQLAAFSRRLAARFGEAPRGAWLTERAWEATIVPALADCGIEYVTVDDYHFLCAGRDPSELDGYFTTEEDGRLLDLFPISETLRYAIPFTPAAQVVAQLEAMDGGNGAAAAIYFDDIEKFGVWPETFEWVYTRGWLADFLRGVLASKRIVTRTYREFRAAHRTRGMVYLPSTGYIEMNEWTLPAGAAARYADLVQRERDQGRYPVVKPFIRGGIWRNFLSRYPEANWMHKRMLGLSARLAASPVASTHPQRSALLHAAQANDAYWHGLFGGIYLPHLRRGIWRALIELERLLDIDAPRSARTQDDPDHDGVDELFLTNETLQVVIKDDGRAGIVELDSYALAQNFGDTMRRHAEVYHRVIEAGHRPDARAEGIASAHERVAWRHDIDPADLVPDPAARGLFLDRFEAADGTSAPIAGYADIGPGTEQPEATFRTASGPLAVDKHLALEPGGLTVVYRIASTVAGRFFVELDLAMPSCDGFGGRLIHGGSIRGGFGEPQDFTDAAEVSLDDRFVGGSVDLRLDPPAHIAARPYRTVSQSEQGFETIMQSLSLRLSWPIDAGACTLGVWLSIRQHTPPEGA